MLHFSTEIKPTAQQVIALYDDAGLKRPTDDAARIQKMLDHADLLATAWDKDILVGIARTITDWVWSAYLADLAVLSSQQKLGIGKKLIEITKEKLGEASMLLLISVPSAMDYYPKMGFEKQEQSFIIKRKR